MRYYLPILLVMALAPQLSNAELQERRIVSVGGVVTEILYALGAGDSVVAVDTSSTYPPSAASLPKVGYHRTLSSEGIFSLKPDLIVLTEEAGPPVVITQLQASKTPLLKIAAPESFSELYTAIETIGDAIDAGEEAAALRSTLSQQESQLTSQVKEIASSPRPRVLFVMQHGNTAPLVAGTDTSASRMISLIGAQNVVTGYSGYKPLTPESAALLDPDIIITTAAADAVTSLPGIATTKAGRNNRVITVDALEFLGFTPRSVTLAQKVHSLIHTS